jgi:hypothetical protein
VTNLHIHSTADLDVQDFYHFRRAPETPAMPAGTGRDALMAVTPTSLDVCPRTLHVDERCVAHGESGSTPDRGDAGDDRRLLVPEPSVKSVSSDYDELLSAFQGAHLRIVGEERE